MCFIPAPCECACLVEEKCGTDGLKFTWYTRHVRRGRGLLEDKVNIEVWCT